METYINRSRFERLLEKYINDEQQAQMDYHDLITIAKNAGYNKAAVKISHIKKDENEHEGILKKLRNEDNR
jgi:rubrerythrin